MKYYILTNQISELGGAQLYTLRRARYLIDKGYKVVIVVHKHTSKFILKDKFQDIAVKVNKPLAKPLYCYNEAKVGNIVNSLSLEKGDFNDTIESHSIDLAPWAEVIAKRLGFKHVIYFLNENRLKSNKFNPYRDFYDSKLARGEVIGITPLSIAMIYDDEIAPGMVKKHSSVPFDEGELVELSSPRLGLINSDRYDVIIGTVSRLSKSYVEVLLKGVLDYANKNKQTKILLIIGGDDPDMSIIRRYKRSYTETENLKIYYTGYINNLGRDFFQMIDVFVGMGTAVINSISQKCATVVINPETNMAAGILGYNVENFAYPEGDSEKPLMIYVEQLIVDKDLRLRVGECGYSLFQKDFSYLNAMRCLDNHISTSSKDIEYYNFSFNVEDYIATRFWYYYTILKKNIKAYMRSLK